MIAIDTNIILRLLTRQPKAQFEAARSLLRKGGLFKHAAKLKLRPVVQVP